MATLPTVPETEPTTQGGWVRAKHDIPADEADEEADEDEPTQETESNVRVVVPHPPT